MCEIIRKTKRKSFTGYKLVAMDDDGKFYSTFTGQKYIIGDVPAPPEYANRLINYWNSGLDITTSPFSHRLFYRRSYAGHTAVFATKNSKQWIGKVKNHYMNFSNMKIVAVKMTISGEILECNYDDYIVYAGTKIDKIQLIK